MAVFPAKAQSAFFRAHSRVSRMLFFILSAVPFASAQAPMLLDGAAALRQARLDWTLGQVPLGPSSMPSLEVGLGGAGSEGAYTPLVGGEGLGTGTRGWGLGLQGRYTRDGWFFSVTALALRDQGRSLGALQRVAVAYRTDSDWRLALEQAPLAWGSGLNGGDLLGDSARPFARLSLGTPSLMLPFGRWRAEVFTGRLEAHPAIPAWRPDREALRSAEAAGLGLGNPMLRGALLRAAFGPLVEGSFGTITLTGGEDPLGRPAPATATRRAALAELRVRLPGLARSMGARGASLTLSRSGAPDSPALSLVPARNLGGLQLVWEGWDLGLEYAGTAPGPTPAPFPQPTHLAGFSTRGDALGPAFGREVITRTIDLGLPLFLEGQGRLRALRLTAPLDATASPSSWFLQAEGQWRTPTGRVGASVASRRDQLQGSGVRWGWAFSLFQAFRVF